MSVVHKYDLFEMMCKLLYDINHLHSYEATKAVAKKAQKKF